ncbi:MAG TPA: hypothetical protein VGO08_00175, partial [Burkholderiales bacterium]|nr:hypothetical protein [Burkholderiales bacterium]
MDAATTASLRRYGIPCQAMVVAPISAKRTSKGYVKRLSVATRFLIASAQAARSDLKAQTKELTGAHKDAAREMGNVVSAPQMPGVARDDCIARARQDQCIASGPPDRAGWISRMRS